MQSLNCIKGNFRLRCILHYRFQSTSSFTDAPAETPISTSNKPSPTFETGAKGYSVEANLSNCKMQFTTKHMARLADGSAVVCEGNNAVLATVTSKMKAIGGYTGFLPLSVDFKQSASALGRIPTNFLRRELSATDGDILFSRIIDRSIRPTFPKDFFFDTQITCNPLSIDETGDAVVLGLNAVSTALAMSPIPVLRTVAASRVALVDGKIIVNPNRAQRKASKLDLLLAGTTDIANKDYRITMIEMDGNQIDMDTITECIKHGFHEIIKILLAIEDLKKQVPDLKKEKYEKKSMPPEFKSMLETFTVMVEGRVRFILMDGMQDKQERDDNLIKAARDTIRLMKNDIANHTNEEFMMEIFWLTVRNNIRRLILDEKKRVDGRSLNEFRKINIDMDLFKNLHGTALFTRGQSQVLSTVTFDSPQAAFRPDAIAELLGSQEMKKFMLHYEFPSFATNDLPKAGRRFNRREIGHGILAEKALKHVIPKEFPYAIRLACQVLESAGSTSMASVCAGSLALYDAGVKLDNPVGGVAIGMVQEKGSTGKEDYMILTDILGIEDFAGDMDFKMAGTHMGFTAMQLDVKSSGLSMEQLLKSMSRGQTGIEHVLEMMTKAMPKPRPHFKSSVPIIETIELLAYKRQLLFKNGAQNAKLIEAETRVKIHQELDGSIIMLAPNKEKMDQAKEYMKSLLEEQTDTQLDYGGIYKAEIVEILEYGVLVTIKKGMRPMLINNNNLAAQRVAHASALGLEVGQQIHIQYLGRDSETGQHRLSRKLLQSINLRPQNLLDDKK